MAFRARTVESVKNGRLTNGSIITVDGVTFGPQERTYEGVPDESQPKFVDNKGRPFGAPTAAQLADDRLVVVTLADGRPWPGSAGDRHGKGKCSNGMQNALLGAVSPFGQWPDALERTAQANHSFLRRDPVAYTRAVQSQRPYREGEKAVMAARAQALASGMDPSRWEGDGLDVESLPAAAAAAETQASQDSDEAKASRQRRRRRAG